MQQSWAAPGSARPVCGLCAAACCYHCSDKGKALWYLLIICEKEWNIMCSLLPFGAMATSVFHIKVLSTALFLQSFQVTHIFKY